MDALYAGELHPFVPDPGHAVLGRPKGDAGTCAAFQKQPVAPGIAGRIGVGIKAFAAGTAVITVIAHARPPVERIQSSKTPDFV